MKSTFKFFVLIGLSVALAVFLTPLVEAPGSLRLEWLGYVIESSAFAFVAASLLCFFLVQIVVLMTVWLFNLPSRHSRRRETKKQILAMDNLTLLLSTSAQANPHLHQKYLKRAKRQLQAFPTLLSALEKNKS